MICYEILPPLAACGPEVDTLESALTLGASHGDGTRIITWSVEPNLPDHKPALVYRSCAMRVYRDGAWETINIHGL